MNKKLFAAFTATSVLAMSFAHVTPVLGNSVENTQAYTWAFEKGLTTMPTFGQFMFENAINREQAARFLVQGAKALDLKLEAGVQSCDYKDLATADQTLVEFINTGCELGVFKAQAHFNPKAVFTREQAELTVARIVHGFDEVVAYAKENNVSEYMAARELLMADEIVKVDIPGQSAVKRGHLLLMLYRLADKDMVATPADPANPAQPTPAQPGHAEVSLVATAGTQNVPYNANGVKVGTIKLSAGKNPTTVSSVVIMRSGLGNVSDLQGAWLANSAVVTDVKSFSTSSQSATIKFAPSLKLAAGQSMDFDVMVALDGQVNSQHSFKVAAVNVSNGTASGTPVELGTIHTSSYKVADVSATVSGKSGIQAGKSNETFATVRVTPVKEATVKKVVINKYQSNPSADLTDVFANVKAYYKGNMVGTVSVTNDKIVVDGLDIVALANETINLDLKGDTTYVGAALTLGLEVSYDNTSLTVLEKNSGYAMPVKTRSTSNVGISGVNLKIAKVTTGSLTVNPGTSNVTLFEANITSDAEFDVTKFWLKASDNFASYAGFSDDKVVLYVNGDDHEIPTSKVATAKGFEYTTSSSKFTVEPKKPVNVKVVGSFKSNAQPAEFRFTFGIDEIKNTTENNTMMVNKTVSGDKVSVKDGNATVQTATKAAGTQSTIYANGDNQEIGRFAIKANDDAMILREFTLENAGQINGSDLETLLASVKLVNVDGDVDMNASVELDGNKIKFTGLSHTIAKGAILNLKVVATTNAFTLDTVSGTIKLAIEANSLKLTRNADGAEVVVAVATQPTFKEYTLGLKGFKAMVEAIAGSKANFRVVLTNEDSESDLTAKSVTLQTQVTTTIDGYNPKICVKTQAGDFDCNSDTVAVEANALGYKTLSLDTLPNKVAVKNGGTVEFFVVVDDETKTLAGTNGSITLTLTKAVYDAGQQQDVNQNVTSSAVWPKK